LEIDFGQFDFRRTSTIEGHVRDVRNQRRRANFATIPAPLPRSSDLSLRRLATTGEIACRPVEREISDDIT